MLSVSKNNCNGSPRSVGGSSATPDVAELGLAHESLQSVVPQFPVTNVFPAPFPGHHIKTFENYVSKHKESVHDPEKFWGTLANELVHWEVPYSTVIKSDSWQQSFSRFEQLGKNESAEHLFNTQWFLGGRLSVAYNCVDRWAAKYSPERVALIYEGDEHQNSKTVTFAALKDISCQLANLLANYGVTKGSRVGVYLPCCPEGVYSLIACSRIGAVHIVVFGGFSSSSLAKRLVDGGCEYLIAADTGFRGGKRIDLLSVAQEAVSGNPKIKCIFMFYRAPRKNGTKRAGSGNWVDIAAEITKYPTSFTNTIMDASDPMFVLHTSGSTGHPKGILHTVGGYLVYAASTHKYSFDINSDTDVYACVADIGWITGHSYIVYGPLCNGMATVLFESLPTFPTPARYWQMIEKHRITHFYTTPTAIRILQKSGNEFVEGCDLSSLRVIGSVGEPLNPEAWHWLYSVVGRRKVSIIDTYWQTETGGHVMVNLPCCPMKPGACEFPFFGITPVMLDPSTGREIEESPCSGVLCFKGPWPGLMKTIDGNHRRMITGYFKPYPGYYFTGDSAFRDEDGCYWIIGRVDDVLNVCGHRLGTAEFENAIASCSDYVVEAAVCGFPDELRGTGVAAFIVLPPHIAATDYYSTVTTAISQAVRETIGPIGLINKYFFVSELPKTRSGKIVRRMLKFVVVGDVEGLLTQDASTLANPQCLSMLSDLTMKDCTV